MCIIYLPDLKRSPFHRFLGLELLDYKEGFIRFSLPTRNEVLREDGSGWIHGGVLSALVDIAGSYAIFTCTGLASATVDLRVDYLRPALGRTLFVSAETRKIGKTLSVADVDIRDEEDRLLVIGRCLYALTSSSPIQPKQVST